MGKSLLKARRPSIVTGISSGTGRVVGNVAAGVGSLPGALAAGVADGFSAGREGYREVQKQRAAYQLVMLPNLKDARNAAQALSKGIKSAKNSKKNLAMSGLASKEYAKELSDINEAVENSKEAFAKQFGIDYDGFSELINNFQNEGEFMDTCRIMADEAAKELAEERKELDTDYAKLDAELTEREQRFNSIVQRLNPGGIRGWAAGVVGRRTTETA